MKKQNRKEKGITLIALVVTIVVLLILAGVSIAMLTGEDGIIKQAQKAKEETEIAEERDKVNLAELGARTKNSSGNIQKEDLIEELNDLIGEDNYTLTGDGPYTVTFKESGRSYVVNPENLEEIEAGKRYEKKQKVTVRDDVVTIPGGATVSGIPEESKSVDDGIVIYIIPEGEEANWQDKEKMQMTYDQFVWVPVKTAYVTEEEVNKDKTSETEADKYANLQAYITEKNKTENNVYPMAIQLADGNYKGILYKFTETTEETTKVTIEPRDYTTTSSNREPAYLTDSTYGDANSSYNNVGITEELLQTEFNTMLGKVAENKGFWVGRYETSNMSGKHEQDATQQIKVVKGATEGVSNTENKNDGTGITWYRMYTQQKSYSKLAKISMTSSMIWGSQWDQIMIWMKDVENESQSSYYIVNSVGMGNYGNISEVNDGYPDTNKLAPTGCFEVKHIYDLAGNVYDWTLEAYDTNFRVYRGGDYDNTNSNDTRADYRYSRYPYYASAINGSRPSLY